jgi:phage portal protein BeeE
MKVTRGSIDPGNVPRSERPGIQIELSIQEAQLIESAITLAQLTNVPETFVRQLIELRFQITRALCDEVSATAVAARDRPTEDHNTAALEEALKQALSTSAYYQRALETIEFQTRNALAGVDHYLRTREHE